MFNTVELYDSCIIVFNYCARTWKISYKRMAKLIKQFDLGNLFIDHFEWFNGMGKEGVAYELKKYIEEHGGQIHAIRKIKVIE